jgi:hypothetical protein
MTAYTDPDIFGILDDKDYCRLTISDITEVCLFDIPGCGMSEGWHKVDPGSFHVDSDARFEFAEAAEGWPFAGPMDAIQTVRRA